MLSVVKHAVGKCSLSTDDVYICTEKYIVTVRTKTCLQRRDVLEEC